ncbi:MAG TPA: 3-phosphoshikimate 1-carboxyvinyltransferase, partial [Anaerovoracaceae bacterium]|nr:3-phosphoshikimate 1-carboxyvinyltransferase [Anaerovoracaceae bacterium]
MDKTNAFEIKCIPGGEVSMPPSKSISHRALICSALAGKGTSIININPMSDDVVATLSGLKAMGFQYKSMGKNSIVVDKGIIPFGKSTGDREDLIFDSKESGSTLRFMIPLVLLYDVKTRIKGEDRLLQRPLKSFLRALELKGGRIYQEDHFIGLKGPLKSGIYEIPGDLSSQFVSGLMMALPLLNGSSEIHLTTELESRPYVKMTMEVMSHFGVQVEEIGSKKFGICGNQSYKPTAYRIERDFSAAAYFLVAGALGCDVWCAGLQDDTIQGDSKITDFIKMCGGNIVRGKNGSVRAIAEELRGITADISQCPDLAPPLAVLLSFCKGKSKIIGAGRLRMKESDRLKSITKTLN